MSILVHVAAQAATDKLQQLRTALTTPEPVYTDEPPLQPPPRLESHQQMQALAAMHHAKRLYPGPAGEILAAEIGAYKELGCVGQPSAPVARLIRELMQ